PLRLSPHCPASSLFVRTPRAPQRPPLSPYTPLFRSRGPLADEACTGAGPGGAGAGVGGPVCLGGGRRRRRRPSHLAARPRRPPRGLWGGEPQPLGEPPPRGGARRRAGAARPSPRAGPAPPPPPRP